MKILPKALLVGVGLGTLALVMTMTNTKPVGAQTTVPTVPVRVTNIPLPVQGTVNANVTNSSLPVTGTVTANINSLPNVNATITNSLSALITNPTTNPVLVRNLTDSLNQEFSDGVCETDVPGGVFCSAFLSNIVVSGNQTFGVTYIPTFTKDSRSVTQAVIEFVSGTCLAGAGDDIVNVSLNTTGPHGIQNFLVPVKTFTTTSQGGYWSFSQATKIYADPGAQIALGVLSLSNLGAVSTTQTCSARFSEILQTQ